MADILIPFFNKSHLVERCLESIRCAISKPHYIILVDDGSSVEERQKVDAYLQQVDLNITVVTHSINKGYKLAIMSGLKEVSSSLIILLNNDTIVGKGFDEKLLQPILENKQIAATAPLSNHPTDLYQYRTHVSGCTPENVSFYQTQLDDSTLENRLTKAPYLTGMCMALDYRLFESQMLFEAKYEHGYFEDLALSCKIRAAGYDLVIVEDCLVYHDGHSTYKEKSQSEKNDIIMHNFRIFQNDWGHLPSHEELLEKMNYAGKVCPI